MNFALQNALTGLLSVLSLYVLLSVVGKAMALFFDIKQALNRERDLEMFAKALGEAATKVDKEKEG